MLDAKTEQLFAEQIAALPDEILNSYLTMIANEFTRRYSPREVAKRTAAIPEITFQSEAGKRRAMKRTPGQRKGPPAKLRPCPKCGEQVGARELRYTHVCKGKP